MSHVLTTSETLQRQRNTRQQQLQQQEDNDEEEEKGEKPKKVKDEKPKNDMVEKKNAKKVLWNGHLFVQVWGKKLVAASTFVCFLFVSQMLNLLNKNWLVLCRYVKILKRNSKTKLNPC